MKTFEELDCWKRSTQLRRKLSVVVKSFPADEKFKLNDQITRASRSVTANIAEGYGRFHYQENIQFCRQSRGSLFELIDHLVVALDERYITEVQFSELRSDIQECLALLNGFINYLSKAKEQHSKVNEPETYYGLTINE